MGVLFLRKLCFLRGYVFAISVNALVGFGSTKYYNDHLQDLSTCCRGKFEGNEFWNSFKFLDFVFGESEAFERRILGGSEPKVVARRF